MTDPELDPNGYPVLRKALADLHGGPANVPSGVDAAILAQARLRLSGGRRRPVLRWLIPASAAAAGLLAAIALWRPSQRAPQGPATASAASSPLDVDRNGRVDILDAFAVARGIESGSPKAPAWDFTNDGVIDRKDVDVIAMAAVRLDDGRGSNPARTEVR